MGMFDPQPSQSDGGAQLNQQQHSQQMQGQDAQAPVSPISGNTNFDALNQHVLLGVQAVGRLKSALLVRNS